ncbi:MAG TPA: formate--tetrahydrofolate ligase [Bacteroidetes bacterium]|nr:formate--tetrahydrofolate ligase [Bacteroidota bacterium]
MKTDLEIAQQARLLPIAEIAEKLAVPAAELEPYGRYVAKLPLSRIDAERASRSRLVLVTALSPTPGGEGKTTVSIGLTDGLNRIGKRAVAALREPSLGPVFGLKGGAAGGGYSQVLPMEDINLHFTGDFSAVEKANNLLSALIDNDIQLKTGGLGIDPRTVLFKRVMDVNDRVLREVIVGLGGTGNGMPRQEGFNITPASEVMAILCLCSGIDDLKQRLGNILVGFRRDGRAVYARETGGVGAMAVLLKEAIKPNLVQTLGGSPVLIHGGPFANIAQGTNSLLATRMAMSLADYVVTEAGFGSDMGAEKFMDIKCRVGGIAPRLWVVVATVRALKYHGGMSAQDLKKPDAEAVQLGFPNLARHLDNAAAFGVPAVVALNTFDTDTEEELQTVERLCAQRGIRAVRTRAWAEGGRGCEDLARAVVETAELGDGILRPLYPLEMPLQEKIRTIARRIYRAGEVEYASAAQRKLQLADRLGLSSLAICMAKTQKSLSDDPTVVGAPEGFTLHVRDVEFAAGAGFVVPIAGDVMRMPGLPAVPAALGMDIDAQGKISGLF